MTKSYVGPTKSYVGDNKSFFHLALQRFHTIQMASARLVWQTCVKKYIWIPWNGGTVYVLVFHTQSRPIIYWNHLFDLCILVSGHNDIWGLYSVKPLLSSQRKITQPYNYSIYLHQTNNAMFTLLSTFQRAKLHIAAINIAEFGLSSYAIYSSANSPG